MIEVRNTENLAGVTVIGDVYDLEQLVDALHEITIGEYDEVDKWSTPYLNISTRVLGVCYDIRHAYQGDRELFTKENGIHDHHQGSLDSIIPRENVYFSCNILYPEMIVTTIALNELIDLRMSKLSKSKYTFDAANHKDVIWDQTIAVIRSFQAAFLKAIEKVLTPATLTRWKKMVVNRYIDIYKITGPFIDSYNLRYLEMSREVRAKKLSTISKRLVEYRTDSEDRAFRAAIDRAVLENDCLESDLRFNGLEYPGEIDW